MAKNYIASYDTLDIIENQVDNLISGDPEREEHLWEDDEDIAALIAEKGYANFKANLKEAGLLDRAEKLAWDDANGDADLFQWAWDDAKEGISEWMESAVPNFKDAPKVWMAAGRNMGWRQRSGHAVVKAKDGQELLRALLPETDVTFEAWTEEYPSTLYMKVSHHDAPMGEFYIVAPWIIELLDNFRSDEWKSVTGESHYDWRLEVKFPDFYPVMILTADKGNADDLGDEEGVFGGDSLLDLLHDSTVRNRIADAVAKGEERIVVEFPEYGAVVSSKGEKGHPWVAILVDFDY